MHFSFSFIWFLGVSGFLGFWVSGSGSYCGSCSCSQVRVQETARALLSEMGGSAAIKKLSQRAGLGDKYVPNLTIQTDDSI